MKTVKRMWIPAVVIVVVVVVGFCVDRLHGIFGHVQITSPGSDLAHDSKSFNPKRVTYEISGVEGATATINYLDLDAQPRHVKDVALPWSITLTTTAPATSPNIVAQSTGDAINCRISVDGQVRFQNTATGFDAQTFCWVKSA